MVSYDDPVLHCAACLGIGTVHDSRCIESRALISSPRAQAVIMLCGAVVLSVAAWLMAASGCGDNIDPAIEIGVRIGEPACVVIDGGIARVDCGGRCAMTTLADRVRLILRPCALVNEYEHRNDGKVGIFGADWLVCYRCGSTGYESMPGVMALCEELAPAGDTLLEDVENLLVNLRSGWEFDKHTEKCIDNRLAEVRARMKAGGR
jgi:hypothetical protein